MLHPMKSPGGIAPILSLGYELQPWPEKVGFLSRARKRNSHRGSVLITTLVISVIVAIVLAGSATVTVSYYSRANSERNYVTALSVAEAGINYELRKISQNPATADQSPGATYSFGGGTFRVYCTNRDGTTPWVVSKPLYVYSVGTVQGVSRTIRVASSNVNTATWNFASASGDLTGPQTYASDGVAPYSIVARGYLATNTPLSLVVGSTWSAGTITPADIYGKVSPGNPSETGLGILADSEHEIVGNYFIQLDMNDPKTRGVSSVTLTISSMQVTEGYAIWGSNTLGKPGKLLQTAINVLGLPNDMVTFTLPNFSTYRYFSVSASGDNVLIQSNLTANITGTASYGVDQEWKEINGM